MKNRKQKAKELKQKIEKLYRLHSRDERTANALAYSSDLK